MHNFNLRCALRIDLPCLLYTPFRYTDVKDTLYNAILKTKLPVLIEVEISTTLMMAK